MHVFERKGRAHTVYSQMNDRVTEEVMKNHDQKKNEIKSKATKKYRRELGEKPGFFSFWSFVFTPFSRDFANSYPAVPPSWVYPLLVPLRLSSPPVFLVSAITLSPTSLSHSLSFSLSSAEHALHFPLILCLSPSSVHSSDSSTLISTFSVQTRFTKMFPSIS